MLVPGSTGSEAGVDKQDWIDNGDTIARRSFGAAVGRRCRLKLDRGHDRAPRLGSSFGLVSESL